MKKRKSFVLTVTLIFAVSIIFLIDGCQYEYTSPLAGKISIRLRTKSNDIEFSPLNNFVLKVTNVQIRRNDGALAVVLEDTKAIDRTTSSYNALDVRARDSNIVMGEAFVPPGDYSDVILLVEPSVSLTLDGYRTIPVDTNGAHGAFVNFNSRFTIREGQTTTIVVTFDLDNALLKGANKFYYKKIHRLLAFQENFDSLSSGSISAMGSLPAGWARNINNDDPAGGAWGIRGDSSSQDYESASSRNNCYSSYTQSAGSWIQTPPIDVSNINVNNRFNTISVPFIEFGARFSAASQSNLTVQVSQTAAFTSFSAASVSSPGTSKWGFYRFRLSQDAVGTGTVYFRWFVTGSGEQSDVRFDDVIVGGDRNSYYISSIQ
jgi:hypothetical protein